MDIPLCFLHIPTMTQSNTVSHSRYLPTEPEAERWGIYVADCGFAEIAPGSEYPQHVGRHPPEYLFSWKGGRTLKEYQLVYITDGRGVFESKPTGRVRVEAGHVFLLLP